MKPSRRSFIRNGLAGMAGTALLSSCRSWHEPSSPGEKLPLLTTDIKPLEKKIFLERQEKARSIMKENRTDALLLTGSVNLQYFTGVSWGRSERLFGMLLPASGEPVWFCPAFERERAEERIPSGNRILVWEEHESPYTLIKHTLLEAGVPNRMLAIGPTVRHFVVDGLQQELSGTEIVLTNGSFITDACRVIKSAREIEYMDLANRLQKLAYRKAFGQLKEGMSPADLSALIAAALSEMGVSGGGWPQFGQNSAYPHGSLETRNLQKGDIVLVDGGCGVEGYRSDVTRTVVFGEPTERQKQVFDIVLKAQQAVQEAIRPGIPCEQLDRIARTIIEESGFGPGYQYFSHRLGHGIGMEGHEYTYLVEGNKILLEPGMTFSNEPGIYIYGEFGVRLEDCFVVTEDGSRVLGGMTCLAIDDPFGGEG